MRFLLDTEAVIWLLQNNVRLPKDLREDIMYSQEQFYTTTITLLEITQLQQGGKIAPSLMGESLVEALHNLTIRIEPLAFDILDTLAGLPVLSIAGKTHLDPFDRAIISTAISRAMTLVSSDK